MPEHTSFFSYLIALFPAFGENMKNLGHTLQGRPVHAADGEPLVASLFVVLIILGLAFVARGKLQNVNEAVVPEARLSIRTFFELLVGMFYNMMKDIMGPTRAKRYFPLIGTAALFIFFSNFLGLIPGFNPPTSSWSITAGCAFVVFLAFNYYGLKENGFGYIKHLCGPMPVLAPLIFPIELLSTCLRPVTLSIRLMLNMAVDHLLLGIMTGLVMLVVPVPIMMLGTLVAIVQVVVFCLLSSIYIGLATEHEHDEAHAHVHAPAHAHAEGAHAHDGHAHA
jgi:F-type H+-transporting ATPase subunit a